jgi:ferredoxin
MENQCVDCGDCMRACPTKAINISNDDFDEIYGYKYRVALIPAVFIGQFPDEISINLIYSAILKLGFTHIYESEQGVEILKNALPDYQNKNKDSKPLLSIFCPAIVRLIQVRFPSLVDNLVLQKPPFEIAATFVQKELIDAGAQKEEIGIFYITPCAAKTIAIKDPVGNYKSPVTGAINMDVFFNRTYTLISKGGLEIDPNVHVDLPSIESVLYTLTKGELSVAKGKCLAIDEIHNVISFLDKVESEEIKGIDYLELRACDESCANGVLTVRNKFLAVDRLQNLIKESHGLNQPNTRPQFRPIIEQSDYLIKNIDIDKVLPRDMIKFDDNIDIALQKMEKVNDILNLLPKVDCTLCGAPNCKSFAIDIMNEKSTIEHCIFIQKMMEEKGELTRKETTVKFKDIWGI